MNVVEHEASSLMYCITILDFIDKNEYISDRIVWNDPFQ